MSAEASPLSKVELLTTTRATSSFDCKKHPILNEWLGKYALASQTSDSARTYGVHRDHNIVGYYSLCAGSVSVEESTARSAKGQPKYPISVIILARLAVDYREQGRGLGKALMKDALLRAVQAADIVAARAVLVHALDEEAKDFYKNFDFEECPVNDLHLMLLMKDLRKAAKSYQLHSQ